jgi:hypothetical protein
VALVLVPHNGPIIGTLLQTVRRAEHEPAWMAHLAKPRLLPRALLLKLHASADRQTAGARQD